MDMRATIGITFGAGVLIGFVIGQLVAAIKDKDDEKNDIFTQPDSDGKTWDEYVKEAEMGSEKIPGGKIETGTSEEDEEFYEEYMAQYRDQTLGEEPDEGADLPQPDDVLRAADAAKALGLRYAYSIPEEAWDEDLGEHWTRKTYFWNKTRSMWLNDDGEEADYTDIHLELGDALCKRICNHTRLYTEGIFRRDDLMMDIRVFVTDDEGMPEAIQRYG